jgi:regulatory protein
MGSAAHPAAGGSPAGRARRPRRRAPSADTSGADGSGLESAELASWPVPVISAGPDLAEPAESADRAEPADRTGRKGRRSARAGREKPADREQRAEREERAEARRRAEFDADPEAVARQICLRLLTAAPRTRAQLADALRRRGVPEQAAETVLERFADVQLIDDGMFARAWVDSRHHGRGLARRALAAELRQRGVAADDIRDAVDLVDPEQEQATAQALVERRLAATRGLPRQARFRRLMGMLARKGYSEGLAYRVVRAALDSEESEAVLYLDRMAGRDATPAEVLDADRFDVPDPEPDDSSGAW